MPYDKTTQRTSPGHYLLAWRNHRGLTQAEFAVRIGIARSYLTKIERGDRRYDQPFLERAAEALGCTVQDLLSRAPEEPEGIGELWASLTAIEQRRALAVLRAMFPGSANTSTDGKADGYGGAGAGSDDVERERRPEAISAVDILRLRCQRRP